MILGGERVASPAPRSGCESIASGPVYQFIQAATVVPRGLIQPLGTMEHQGESDVKTVQQADIPAFLIELEDAFNRAMISNDVDQIARCITDDWILVTPEAGPVPRSRILGVIGSGVLSHATMTKVATHACVAGDIAWVTGRGQNTGTFSGEPIEADEYITDVYRKVDGEWRCMLTHLTPARRRQQGGA